MNHLDQIALLDRGLPPPADAGIFGASIPEDYAGIVIIPVPFEVTTSYGSGASLAPHSLIQASHQLDLFDPEFGEAYKVGINLGKPDSSWSEWNAEGKKLAKSVMSSYEVGETPDPNTLDRVNRISSKLNTAVEDVAHSILDGGKIPGVLGGDHSAPFGLLKALNQRFDDFGILHIDAHHDLRKAYEGFEHSHASIMYNVLANCNHMSLLLSIGIRDFSREEYQLAKESERVHTIYDRQITLERWNASLLSALEQAVKKLPKYVYVSFDIDGLDPALCPSTGTPVPGGMSFSEAMMLLELLDKNGKQVIGFDLCEIVPGNDDWDANVGARVLYKLCGVVAKSNALKYLS
ncbi:MAG: agmatinase family protein [Pseudobacteriovorax sp.]|nr:agmatinase family protein [Pseudobacteriovorax sp.]